jgi:hypothetical protein
MPAITDDQPERRATCPAYLRMGFPLSRIDAFPILEREPDFAVAKSGVRFF